MRPGSLNYHIYLGSRHHGEGGVTMYFLIEILDEELYILPNPTFLLGTYTANFSYHSDFYVSSCSNI